MTTLYVRQLATRVGMKLTPVAHDVAIEGVFGEADTDESVHTSRP